ncbi:MAG: hypothetical protein DRP57_03945 [Spirochaetes bacterium]|nr:MAG: hypothetical protein DRP57_03945 [Spirochaetota bacterium]
MTKNPEMNTTIRKARINLSIFTLSNLLLLLALIFSLLSCNINDTAATKPPAETTGGTETEPESEPEPIQTPAFHKEFSGSTALVLDPFNLPKGLYKITVNTSGYFQLFDVNNDTTIFNLFEGQGNGTEIVFNSKGGDYLFRTDNISANWTLIFTNIDFSNPAPISSINSITEDVMKVFGPYEMDKNAQYKVTMYTNGFLQLFPINSITGGEESYIFNAFSGNYGAQTVYKPSASIMLFRTDNITEAYRLVFQKLQ